MTNTNAREITPIVGADGRTYVALGDVVEWLLWASEQMSNGDMAIAFEVAGDGLADLWLDIAIERMEKQP